MCLDLLIGLDSGAGHLIFGETLTWSVLGILSNEYSIETTLIWTCTGELYYFDYNFVPGIVAAYPNITLEHYLNFNLISLTGRPSLRQLKIRRIGNSQSDCAIPFVHQLNWKNQANLRWGN